jgi:hypothetical protein
MNKQYILRLAQSLGLVAAVTTGLITVYPLLQGHPDWGQVIYMFVVTVLFALGHSAAAHAHDANFGDALSKDLDALQQLFAESPAQARRSRGEHEF